MHKLVLMAAILIAPAAAEAADYYGVLSGSQLVPAVMTDASGKGFVTLNGDMMEVSLYFANLSSPLTAGHIHCCAAAGANAGVAIEFDVPALTDGVYMGQFDLSLTSSYSAAFLADSGGTAAMAKMRLLSAFDSGTSYFALHNSVYPAGELRGQIAAVPEPASWAMFILGFGVVGASYRRRTPALS